MAFNGDRKCILSAQKLNSVYPLKKRILFNFSDLKEDFRVDTEDINVALGDEAVLSCWPPKGHPAPVITWKKDGQQMELHDKR